MEIFLGENPAGTNGDKSKAIDAQQKAIEALKSKKDFSASEMAALEPCLQQYRKNVAGIRWLRHTVY